MRNCCVQPKQNTIRKFVNTISPVNGTHTSKVPLNQMQRREREWASHTIHISFQNTGEIVHILAIRAYTHNMHAIIHYMKTQCSPYTYTGICRIDIHTYLYIFMHIIYVCMVYIYVSIEMGKIVARRLNFSARQFGQNMTSSLLFFLLFFLVN